MQSLRKTTAAAAIAVLASIVLTGCSGSDSTGTSAVADGCTPSTAGITTLTAGTLSVNVLVSAPYALLDNNNAFSGVDADIVKAIAARECLTVAPTSVDGPALINSIKTERADIAIGGIYFTKDRAAQISLSDPMYGDSMAILSSQGYSSVDELKGLKIGTVQGALWEADLQSVLGTDNVVGYPSPAAILSDLKTGRLDAAVFAIAEAAVRAAADPSLKAVSLKADDKIAASTQPGQVVAGINPTNPTLAAAFNKDLAALIKDGTVAKILTTYGLDPALAGSGKS